MEEITRSRVEDRGGKKQTEGGESSKHDTTKIGRAEGHCCDMQST
jgi:hypothetical protein